MASQHVLIFHVDGHLGFHILKQVLEESHHVRAVVAEQENLELVKGTASRLGLPTFELFCLQDMLLDEQVFDKVVEGANSIIISSPNLKAQNGTLRDNLLSVAQAEMAVLKAAAKSLTLKRIIITSSVYALDMLALDEDVPLNATSLGPLPEPRVAPSPVTETCLLSYRQRRANYINFVMTRTPIFDVIHIFVPVVLGHDYLAYTAAYMELSGTNKHVIDIIRGINSSSNLVTGAIHVGDCAKLHICALYPAVEGNRDYVANACYVDWYHKNSQGFSIFDDVLWKLFGDKLPETKLKVGGSIGNFAVRFDTTETEKMFNIKWQDLEAQIKEVVIQYQGLLHAESTEAASSEAANFEPNTPVVEKRRTRKR